MIDLNKKNISYFLPPIQTTSPSKNISLTEVYQLIVSDELKELTHKLRTADKEYKVLKETKCPSITSSGVFYYRCDDGMKYHNEIICIDIDKFEDEEKLEEIKLKLINDPYHYTLLLYRSPSGRGIKWFTKIDLKQCGHRKWFESIRNYLYQTYGIVADQTCINVSRACFLCHDPEAYACSEIMNNLIIN